MNRNGALLVVLAGSLAVGSSHAQSVAPPVSPPVTPPTLAPTTPPEKVAPPATVRPPANVDPGMRVAPQSTAKLPTPIVRPHGHDDGTVIVPK